MAELEGEAEALTERPPPEVATPHGRADLMHRGIRCATEVALANHMDRAGAEDLALRAVTVLWEGLGKPGGYDPSLPLEPFIGGITRNLMANDARREDQEDERGLEFSRELGEQQREWMDPLARVRMKELDALYLKALRTVPKVCREVFVLKKHKHLSDEEIAQLLGIALGTVRVHLRNGTKLLANRLYPHLKEGP